MNLQVLIDGEAETALGDEAFVARWEELCAACPWATSFQGPAYVRTWLRHYGEAYRPVLISGSDADGRLDGVLALAIDRTSGEAVAAGAHQAEYQGWLARPGASAAFLPKALAALARIVDGDRLRLKFLPPALTQDIERLLDGMPYPFKVRREKTPIVDLTTDPPPWDSMRKKSNKSRLSRLRRLGEITFERCRLGAPEEAARAREIVEALAPMYDLRQGAVNNVCPFREDVRKGAFHVGLLTGTPTEALVMKVGGEIVAGIIGPCDDGVLSVGVFAHSPLLAKHSPGKVLLLCGGEFLAGEGVRAIDLTPGGDWKWRFANASREVCEISFYLRRSRYLREAAGERCLAVAKAALGAVGVTPAMARRLVAAFRGGGAAKPRPEPGEEVRLYAFPASRANGADADDRFRRDALVDFLCYLPDGEWRARRTFLEAALARLEAGDHGYALVDHGVLVQCGWLAERRKSVRAANAEGEVPCPENTAYLYDLYCHPEAGGRALCDAAIRRMLRDAANIPGTEWIYASVPASDDSLRGAVEAAGFVPVDSAAA